MSRGEAKNSILLSSRHGYLLEPTKWPKGSQASCGVWREDSGLLSRPCRKKGPHLAKTEASHGFSRAAASVWGFSRGTTGSSGSLSYGAREVRSPCAWQGVRVISIESWKQNRASRHVEVGLSRSFSHCGRKPWVPSTCAGDLMELLQVPLRSQGYCGVWRGLLGFHWVWCNG